MTRYMAVIAVAAALGLGLSGKPNSTNGSWQLDPKHSDVQLITNGTTNFGKDKVNFTLGYGRVMGVFKVDGSDLANSKVELHMYPATAMTEPIGEDGEFKNRWLSDLASHTLMCFHSKKMARTADGKLQVTGDLVLTRVDRNVEANPTEAYSGPVYGPPIVHRVSREATFVFDLPGAGDSGHATFNSSGSTSVSREGFPQLMKAVLSTYWPPVVKEENCENTSSGTEGYSGFRCTGTFMQGSGLPPAPRQVGEDYPGASNYSEVVGSQLTLVVHLRLTSGTASGM